MRYKVGMYGGSFDPLHTGHLHDIIKAASMCEELYIIISYCEGRESTSKELRYRWILNSTKHLDNVKIFLLEDKAVSKEEYDTDYYWEKGANDIKVLIGKPIDAVFCGDDYLGKNRFERLYCPQSEIVYFKRKEVPISSTQIRGWASKNWDYVPQVCRDYYTKKVLIIGSESTGKSVLTKNLALAYNTNCVEEAGRDVCEYAGGEELMVSDDMYEILMRHKVSIMDAAKNSNRILFVDTDALTTLFYSQLLLQNGDEIKRCTDLAQAINAVSSFDLVLFMEPTEKFVQDGTRNEDIAADRDFYSQELKKVFIERNVNFYSLDGDYYDRFIKAKELIKQVLSIDTQW